MEDLWGRIMLLLIMLPRNWVEKFSSKTHTKKGRFLSEGNEDED